MSEEQIRNLIAAEVRGEADPEDVRFLEDNLQIWSDGLISLVQDVDAQLALRKAVSFANPEDRNHYETWKAAAVRFKVSCIARRRTVLAKMREQGIPSKNTHQRYDADNYETLLDIRDALYHLIDLLEKNK